MGGNFSFRAIIKNNNFFNVNGILHPYGLSELNISNVYLTHEEGSENYIHANVYSNQRKHNLHIGKTWFDVNNALDLSASLIVEKNNIDLVFYSEYKKNNTDIILGAKVIERLNEPRLFLGLIKSFDKSKNTNILLKVSNIEDLKPKVSSLKKVRYKELPKIWKRNMKF